MLLRVAQTKKYCLCMKKQVTEDVKRITDGYKKLKIEPVELTMMQFIPVEEYQTGFLSLQMSYTVMLILSLPWLRTFHHLHTSITMSILQ